MKNAVLILFLILFSFISKAQSPTLIKYSLIESRLYSFQIGGKTDSSKYIATAFDKTKGLYPIIKKADAAGSNAIYFEEKNVINVCIFQGAIPKNVTVRELQALFKSAQTSKSNNSTTYFERKDVFFENTSFGVEVLKHGNFRYYSSNFKGMGVTLFSANKITFIDSNNPRHLGYYFDFPSNDTKNVKNCYNWQTTDKKAFLEFQGNITSKDGANIPLVNSITSDIDKPIKTGMTSLSLSQTTSKSKAFLDLNVMFSSKNKPSKGVDYHVYYTITGVPDKTFGIVVKFAGCNTNSLENFLILIIYPTDSDGNPIIYGQPTGTIIAGNPTP